MALQIVLIASSGSIHGVKRIFAAPSGGYFRTKNLFFMDYEPLEPGLGTAGRWLAIFFVDTGSL